jgi:CBS domain-containing protein
MKSRIPAVFARIQAKLLQCGDDSALPASKTGRSIHDNDRAHSPAVFPFCRGIRGKTSNWRSVVMQVRHILQAKGRDVVTIPESATIAEAARLLTNKRIGALVVRDEAGELTGIISERDLVQAIARVGAAALGDTVADHMTPGPETCVENDAVESLMETMTCGRFRHLPVLDDQLRLCGMVSIGDVVKSRIAETVSEAAALRDYISAAM